MFAQHPESSCINNNKKNNIINTQGLVHTIIEYRFSVKFRLNHFNRKFIWLDICINISTNY